MLYVLAWYGGEMLLSRAFHWRMGRMTPVVMILRDLALPALWITAWFGDRFVWRGNTMSVAPDGTTKPAATVRIRRIVDKTKARAKAFTALRH